MIHFIYYFLFIFSDLTCVTAVQYALLYTTINDLGVPLYTTMEDVLRFAIPALDVPARWYNTTRTVNRNLRRGLYSNIVLNSTEQCDIQTKHTFIGHVCQSFNIDQTTLTCTVPSPRSDICISVWAFHELCIYKNKHSYSWKDVSSWAKGLYLQKWSVILTEWNTCSKKSINFINHIRNTGKLKILKLWNICNFSNSWMKLCLLQQVLSLLMSKLKINNCLKCVWSYKSAKA